MGERQGVNAVTPTAQALLQDPVYVFGKVQMRDEGPGGKTRLDADRDGDGDGDESDDGMEKEKSTARWGTVFYNAVGVTDVVGT
jgi:hypothetical protein